MQNSERLLSIVPPENRICASRWNLAQRDRVGGWPGEHLLARTAVMQQLQLRGIRRRSGTCRAPALQAQSYAGVRVSRLGQCG